VAQLQEVSQKTSGDAYASTSVRVVNEISAGKKNLDFKVADSGDFTAYRKFLKFIFVVRSFVDFICVGLLFFTLIKISKIVINSLYKILWNLLPIMQFAGLVSVTGS
jgi:hypothetical protein